MLEHTRFDTQFFADGLDVPNLCKDNFADNVSRGGRISRTLYENLANPG